MNLKLTNPRYSVESANNLYRRLGNKFPLCLSIEMDHLFFFTLKEEPKSVNKQSMKAIVENGEKNEEQIYHIIYLSEEFTFSSIPTITKLYPPLSSPKTQKENKNKKKMKTSFLCIYITLPTHNQTT